MLFEKVDSRDYFSQLQSYLDYNVFVAMQPLKYFILITKILFVIRHIE